MPAIITNKFRINNAEQFSESFSETASQVYYLGIGRPQPFGTATRPDGRTDYEGTDSAPNTPGDTIAREFYTYDDLVAAKRIQTSDVSFVIPRRNWTAGVVFDTYSHDIGEYTTGSTSVKKTSNSGATTLFDSTFYVLSSARNVYKCLDNNGGATSTDEPTGVSTSVITTTDSYKWKFMYTLSAAQQANFLSTDFMAVSPNSNPSSDQSNVISAAVDGSIDVVKIKTPGSGGTNGTFAGMSIKGDGSGGVATVVVGGGAVTSVTVTTPGTGYTFATISNAEIVTAGATNLAGSELDVIIPPKGGHGANAQEELGAFFVMMNTSLEGTESANSGDFSAVNDFRKIALLRDPTKSASAVTANTARLTKAIKIATSPTPGTFTADEEINQASTGAVGKVVEWDSTNNILYYIQTRHNDAGVDGNGNLTSFSGANVITGQGGGSPTGTPDTSSTGTVSNVSFTSGYSVPEIDHDTGDVLYIENRTPIQRAPDQTENIKLVIEF
jgi:hypothetical protein